MKLHQYARRLSALLVAAIFFCGCATEERDEAAKDLAREQERSDSLKASSTELARQKKGIEERLRQLEEEKKAITEKVDVLVKELDEGRMEATVTESEARQESLTAVRKRLQASQESLQKELDGVADSIETVKGHLLKAEEQVEGLVKEKTYVSGLEEEAEKKLRTGVAQIDLTLDELAREKRQEEAKIALNE
ncbi:MAG: hypothetical protein WBG01_12365, partial [Bacteroidota bacterium]